MPNHYSSYSNTKVLFPLISKCEDRKFMANLQQILTAFNPAFNTVFVSDASGNPVSEIRWIQRPTVMVKKFHRKVLDKNGYFFQEK